MAYMFRTFYKRYDTGKVKTMRTPNTYKTIKDARKGANVSVRGTGIYELGKEKLKGEVWAEIFKVPIEPMFSEPKPLLYVFYDPSTGKAFVGGKTKRGMVRNRYILSDGSLSENGPYD